MKEYDLIVVGGGAAAFSAMLKATELRASVAMVEKGVLGGTCVNVGCVPSKHLLTTAEHYKELTGSKHKGVSHPQAFLDFKKVMQNKNQLVLGLRKAKYETVLKSAGADFYSGKAEFISMNSVRVGGKLLRAKKFVVATGSSTIIPSIKGIDESGFLTNVSALELKKVPESMIVIGGGPLGLEFAQMFSRFGSKVTVLQRGERVIPREEPEAAKALAQYLKQEGIQIYVGADVLSVEKRGETRFVTALVGSKKRVFKANAILLASGRNPNARGFGLEEVGVKIGKRGEIMVNEFLQTTVESIYAAGDCTGEPMLETVAGKAGAIAAENAIKGNKKEIDLRVLPHAIFTNPQVASVGMTEEIANAKNFACNCRVLEMKNVPKALIIEDPRGLVKMVADSKTNRILGVTIVSPIAAEIIHEAAMIVKNNMTIQEVIDTTHVFPTLAEALKICAQSYYRDISKLSCCVE